MTDPHTDPLRLDPPHDVGRDEFVPPPLKPGSTANRPPHANLDDDADAALGGLEPIPSTDDSPTIISRNTPRPSDSPTSGDVRGRRLAHFELIEQIGAGGMAAVLRARDTQLDRCVALKILPPDLAKDEENIKRFHQEARAAAKLDHENIARVFFCGEDQRLHFIAFEFVEGENLRTILDQRGKIGVNESLTYLIQVCAGLSHAAARSVVHRDIKPSNIIITPNGRAKLVDMGLARTLENPHEGGLTQSGVTLGTFDYISPEQAMEPRDADVRSDIYSLGCTFYHMMTGRPPVPEGTAARKLHHHQHVKPVDPRELVPGLPDEVALILARMMAKDPRERYQTADDLLRHLLAVARKLGATADVPESVLFVEAALPTASGPGRPLFLGGLAVAAVILLVFLLEPKESNKTPRVPKSGRTVEPIDTAPPPGVKDSIVKNLAPILDPKGAKRVPRFSGKNRDDLQKFLEENTEADDLEVELTGDLELALTQDSSERGLVVKARKSVTILAATNLKGPPTLRMMYKDLIGPQQSADLWANPLAALTIDAPSSKIEGLRIEVLSGGSLDCQMVGIRYKGGKAHSLRNCELIQVLPKEGYSLAGVLVEPNKDDVKQRPELSLTGNVFVGYSDYRPKDETPYAFRDLKTQGLQAVVLAGPTKVLAQDCAFGPYESVFLFLRPQGARADSRSFVTLQNGSILAGNQSAVFDLAEGVTASLVLNKSLVSSEADDEEGAVVIRGKISSSTIGFHGTDNRYHNLKPFWSDGGKTLVETPEELTRLTLGSRDERSQMLNTSPWETSNPCTLLEAKNFVAAFKIKNDAAELRQPLAEEKPLGVVQFLGQGPLQTFSRLQPLTAPNRKFRYVKPGTNDSLNGIYSSLAQALEAAQRGDTILLQHTGELPVGPLLRLERKDFDVTIQPDQGYRPILVAGDSQDANLTLFRLYDGKLKLEGLEIRLLGKKQTTSLSLVSFAGEGRCVCKDCLITMDRATQDTLLNLALVEPDGRSKTMVDRIAPQFILEDSFVRGEGDLVVVRANRPLDMEMNHCLAALRGSLVIVSPGLEAPLPGSLPVNLKFLQATFYLTGNVIGWKVDKETKDAKDSRLLTSISCNAKHCAFLPAAPGNALIRLDVPEALLDRVNQNLTWTVEENVFGNYATLFDQPGLPGMNLQQLSAERWEIATHDKSSKFKVQLSNPPGSETSFSSLTPGQFRLMADSSRMESDNWGADLAALQKLLPTDPNR